MRNEKLSPAEACYCLWGRKKKVHKNVELIFMENIKTMFIYNFQIITCQIVRLIPSLVQMLKIQIVIEYVCVCVCHGWYEQIIEGSQ